MTDVELYHRFRVCLQWVDPNVLSDSQITTCLSIAAEWLAAQLKYPTGSYTQTIEASISEYPLPEDVAMVISVTWNNQMLEPTSLYRLDGEGGNWRTQAASNPIQYFVFGRKLTLKPSPSSGAVTTDPGVVVRYLGSPLPSGITLQLGEMDQNLLIFKGVQIYCRTHISDDSAARCANMADEISEWLPLARLRAQNALKEYRPQIRPEITRRGSAR